MAKSRRDKFEDQLRALQTDINDLSHKLSIPATYTSNAYSSSLSSTPQQKTIVSKGEASTSVKTGSSKVVNRTTATLSSSGLTSVRTLQSASAANYQPTRSSRVEISNNRDINLYEEGTLDGLTNGYRDQPYANESSNHTDHREDSLSETYSLIRERNNLLNRLEQSQNTIEELRRAVTESRELQVTYDRLVQDHELVQVSLESSERIRKQQKELITLLQRSGGGGGVGGIVAGTGAGGGTLDLLGASFSNSTVSTAAENRDWLNASGNQNNNGWNEYGESYGSQSFSNINSFDENISEKNQKLKVMSSKKKNRTTKQKNSNSNTVVSNNSNNANGGINTSYNSRASYLNHTRSSSSSAGRGKNSAINSNNNNNSPINNISRDRDSNSNNNNYSNSSNDNNNSKSSSSSSRLSTAPHRTTPRSLTQTQSFGQSDSTHSERKHSPSLSHVLQLARNGHGNKNENGNGNIMRSGEDYIGLKDGHNHQHTHRHQGDIGSSVYDERHSISSKGSGGSHDSHISARTSPQAPLSPSLHSIPNYSRYDEQLRKSLDRLGIESYSDTSNQHQGQHQLQLQHQRAVQVSPSRRRSGDGDHTMSFPLPLPLDRDSGSPIRPRSAPSSASASPQSMRSGRLSVGDRRGPVGAGVGVGGDEDGRSGIAMVRNGGGGRYSAVRSNSTGRMNSSSGRMDSMADQTFDSHPPLPPQRTSGRPPIPVPTRAHLPPPPPPPYHSDPRASPHSAPRDLGGRPLPLFSSLLGPSYSRM